MERHSKHRPCPVCGGHTGLRSGQGIRCFGYTAGAWTYCTREEYAGDAPYVAEAQAYRHQIASGCRCGASHGDGPVPEPQHRPRRDAGNADRLAPDVLDLIFRRHLELNPLRAEHRAVYASRGRADLAAAITHGYSSGPLGYTAARAVVDQLAAEFGAEVLARAPGFYRHRSSGRLVTHTATVTDDFALIPTRDAAGRITGLVRHTMTGAEAKYRVFKGGGAPFTIAGPDWQPGERRDLYVIEGHHKAHVADQLGLRRVVGLQGAALSAAALTAIIALRPDRVIETLDADKFINPNIAAARLAMQRKLQDAGLNVLTAVWEMPAGKGVDDLLAAGGRFRLRTVARRPAVGPRQPVPIADPTPAAVGMSLAEAQRITEHAIDDFVAHPRRNAGKVQVIVAPPGAGKTHAVRAALAKHRAAGRVLVATHQQAQEFAASDPTRVTAVVGRNEENCEHFPAVETARRRGWDVAEMLCKSCPVRRGCVYYQQFATAGTLVGPVEMIGSGAFLRHGQVVVADDAQIERALIDERSITSATAWQLSEAVDPGPLRDVLKVVARAIDAHPNGMAPLFGVAPWDALARAAGDAEQLVRLIRGLPLVEDLRPAPDPDSGRGYLTAEEIEAAPPAVLSTLVRMLRGELARFAAGDEFNSGLSIYAGDPGRPGKLCLRSLRPPVLDPDTNAPVLHGRALLVLDATPLEPLTQSLSEGMERLPDVRPMVTMPPNVTITQIADRFAGKTAAESERGQAALLASWQAARADYPADREAVLCAKFLKPQIVAGGVSEERVLTFHSNRGLNTIQDADVLHVLGRPQAPDHQALALAHVLYADEEPISPHLAMQLEPYAGYQAPDGSGRAIEVLDFVDERVSAIFRQHREAELWQGLHRARPYRVADAQMNIFEPDEVRIARGTATRRTVRLVLHTAQPVPGLRVDELVYTPEATPNEARAAEAEARVQAAITVVAASGVPLTVRAVARAARAHPATVSRVLTATPPAPGILYGGDHALIGERSNKGVITPVQNFLQGAGGAGVEEEWPPPSPPPPRPQRPVDAVIASADLARPRVAPAPYRHPPPAHCPACAGALVGYGCWRCADGFCGDCGARTGSPLYPRCRPCEIAIEVRRWARKSIAGADAAGG